MPGRATDNDPGQVPGFLCSAETTGKEAVFVNVVVAPVHATSNNLASSLAEDFFGLSQTSPTGAQLRVFRLQRVAHDHCGRRDKAETLDRIHELPQHVLGTFPCIA